MLVENNEISIRFKQIRKELGLSQMDFAEKLNANRHTITKIETGNSNISSEILTNAILNLNISPTWIYTGLGSMFLDSYVTNIGKANVKLYNIDASAGGLIAAQDREGVLAQWFIPDLVGEHIAVNCLGNSMSPMINNGDKIVAKEVTRNDLRDGYVYIVVLTDGAVKVKRLRLDNQVAMLWSDNVLYTPRYEKLDLSEVVKMFHVVMVLKPVI